MRLRSVFAAIAVTLAACGSGGRSASTPAQGSFTFVPVAGMICADGSSTGLGISPGGSQVLVFLGGGGACWGANPNECVFEPLLPPRSFAAGDLASYESTYLARSILDASLVGNPFSRFTKVFVPYCTGDVHAGDATRTYGTETWVHHGYRNLQAALAYVRSNFAPTRVVIAGSSAGGFGSLVAYALAREEWPESEGVTAGLVDDSGPTLEPSVIATLQGAWWDAWGLDSTVTPICPGCKADLSEFWPTLSAAHPGDLLALLSTTDDSTIEAFLGLGSGEFGDALDTLAAKINSLPQGNAKTFQVAGSGHAMLAAPAAFAAGMTPPTTPLLGWLDPIAVGTGAFEPAGP